MADFNGQYAQALASLYNQLQSAGQGGGNDLTQTSQPNGGQVRAGGYYIDNPVAAYPMTMGNTYDNATRVGNFSPILRDNNGNVTGLMDEDALQTYASGVLNNQHPDYRNLQMGSSYPTKEQAWANAEKINNLQTAYNALKNGGR